MRALADFNIELWLRNVMIDTSGDVENMKKGLIQALTDELEKMDLSDMIRDCDEADRKITDVDLEILDITYTINVSNIEYSIEDQGKDLPDHLTVTVGFMSKYEGPITSDLELNDAMRDTVADEIQFKLNLEERPIAFDCEVIDFE